MVSAQSKQLFLVQSECKRDVTRKRFLSLSNRMNELGEFIKERQNIYQSIQAMIKGIKLFYIRANSSVIKALDCRSGKSQRWQKDFYRDCMSDISQLSCE